MKTVSVKAGRPRTVTLTKHGKIWSAVLAETALESYNTSGRSSSRIANGYMCGYGNRSLRVAARSLKVDNGPWRDRRRGPSGPIKRTDVPVSTPRARPSTAAKIIALKYGSPSRTAEMMMKTLTTSPRCHPCGRNNPGTGTTR